MSRPLVKHVWRGRDNHFTILFEEVHADRTVTPIDFVSVQSMLVRIGTHETTVASGAADPAVNWFNPALNTGEIQFTLGAWAEAESIVEAVYPIELIALEPANPDGIVLLSEDTRLLMVSVHASISHTVTVESLAAQADLPDIAISA